MKRSVIFAFLLVALLAFAPAAEAGWYMSFGQAQRAARNSARELCNTDSECYAYGAHCLRVTQQRFSCEDWTISAGITDEITCEWLETVGVGRGGYVTPRYVVGSMDCY